MPVKNLFYFLCLLLLGSCATKSVLQPFQSERLHIQPLTANTAIHVSYLETASFGKVPCNGLIYLHDGEAIIFETPTDDEGSAALIRYVEKDLNHQIKAVIVHHFHEDCLGGLDAFHQAGIPSYANNRTIDRAKADSLVVPQNGFDKNFQINLKGKTVEVSFPGEGHTTDNIVSYIPDEKVLFGGCLIKANGAGKGFLGDANVGTWSGTVEAVKRQFPDAEYIVPGHGKAGNRELLDYTIGMFRE